MTAKDDAHDRLCSMCGYHFHSNRRPSHGMTARSTSVIDLHFRLSRWRVYIATLDFRGSRVIQAPEILLNLHHTLHIHITKQWLPSRPAFLERVSPVSAELGFLPFFAHHYSHVQACPSKSSTTHSSHPTLSCSLCTLSSNDPQRSLPQEK